ncbi:MAG: DNA polymerase III subunit epsilon, partial [Arenicellales bacterium]
HKIIEIGCVELMGRTITGSRYQQFLIPEREIDEGALNVHGIELRELQDKPIFANIADDFMQYIQGATLIIHNASFDLGFLNHELSLIAPKGTEPRKISDICEVIDTLDMARKMHPGQRNSLDALCQRYYLDNTHRTLHGALLDSEILADVYLAMTGGQLNMLGEAQTDEDEAVLVEHEKVGTQRAPLKIVVAKADELAEHEKWLALLSDKSGETVSW